MYEIIKINNRLNQTKNKETAINYFLKIHTHNGMH